MPHISIRDWNEDDRPREKLMSQGADVCSDAELIAILINNGTRGKSAVEIARELLATCNNNLLTLINKDFSEIKKIGGIGPAKACVIKAAAELGRRIRSANLPELPVLRCSKDVFDVMEFLQQVNHEEFWALFCNSAGKLVEKKLIGKGYSNRVFVEIKDIIGHAIMIKATRVILCHNHPAGTLNPSNEDIALTKNIAQACKLLGISMPEHIIVSPKGYYSFSDEGMI